MFEASAQYAGVIRQFFARHPAPADEEAVPARPLLWREMAAELGLAGLTVPQELGGQGGGAGDLAAAACELGRLGWSGPAIPTAGVAVHLLARLDPGDSRGLRASIACGRLIAVAVHEGSRGDDLECGGTTVAGGDEAATVTGGKTFVDGGAYADAFLVIASDSGQLAVVAVPASAPGVARTALPGLDAGRGICRLSLDDAPGQVLARGDAVRQAAADSWLLGAGLTACDCAGLAGRALDLSLEYSLTRRQFGRPIAGFQAIKHKLVDMYVTVQAARSCAEAVAQADPAGGPRWRTEASMAKAYASEAAMSVVREAVQVHGGIGFTWEHELSRHFRRATVNHALYGTPARHRALVAQALLG